MLDRALENDNVVRSFAAVSFSERPTDDGDVVHADFTEKGACLFGRFFGFLQGDY